MIPFQMGEALGNRTSNHRTLERRRVRRCRAFFTPSQYHNGYWGQQGVWAHDGPMHWVQPPLHHHHHFTSFWGDGRMPVTRIPNAEDPFGARYHMVFFNTWHAFPLHPPSSTTVGCWRRKGVGTTTAICSLTLTTIITDYYLGV